MERLVAFGAGAVLAFALGYLVSYQVNVAEGEDDVDRGSRELEAAGDDGAGLVDARTPKLKALPDLANHGDDVLTKDMSPAEVQDLKTMLLPHLTPADIAGWRAARDAYVAAFLASGLGPWAVGADGAPGKRFDRAVAAEAEGRYEGKIALSETGDAAAVAYDLTLELKGYNGKMPEGRLAVHTEDGSPLWGLQFRWRLVGTDKEARKLFVVFPAFNEATVARADFLALAVPGGIEAGRAVSGELVGLSQEMIWVRVGVFELLKSQ